MNVAVIGAGSWGTALAHLLATAGNDVVIWARRDDVVDGIEHGHANPRYLSSTRLHDRVHATTDFERCVSGAEAVCVVTPSTVLRQTFARMAPHLGADVPVLICSKGVEAETGLLPTEIAEAELGGSQRLAVLSGPNHAEEVIEGVPSATVIASTSTATARLFQDLFSTDTFRVYTSTDVVGVEVCAACKNVIAIAVGIAYGIGYGDNTAALLITRGLAEMSRLAGALGGEPITCMGLAGAGDMVATCMSRHSRNRCFGEELAAGVSLDDYRDRTHMVVEGAVACRTLEPLAASCGVELPITDVVRRIVWDGVDIRAIVRGLSDRPLKEEFHD